MEINSKLRQLDYFMEIQDCLQESSSKIIEIYNEFDQSITYKADNSPLTKADIASHELI